MFGGLVGALEIEKRFVFLEIFLEMFGGPSTNGVENSPKLDAAVSGSNEAEPCWSIGDLEDKNCGESNSVEGSLGISWKRLVI